MLYRPRADSSRLAAQPILDRELAAMNIALKRMFGVSIAIIAVTLILICTEIFWWSWRDTTVYTDRFEEAKFQMLKPGMKLSEVYDLLGKPIAVRQENLPERLCYEENSIVYTDTAFVIRNMFHMPRCVWVSSAGLVLKVTGTGMAAIKEGMQVAEVFRILGEPQEQFPESAITLHYTTPGGEGLFRGRIVSVDQNNQVSQVVSYEFYD